MNLKWNTYRNFRNFDYEIFFNFYDTRRIGSKKSRLIRHTCVYLPSDKYNSFVI